MNRFEKLKNANPQEAEALIAEIVGEDLAKKFFIEERAIIEAENAEVGSFVKYAGIEWVVLDKKVDRVLIFAKDRLCDWAFDSDNRNNWKESTLREELNNFNDDNLHKGFKELEKINKYDLIEFKRDLTTDDGLTDYGSCFDYISLISCEEYRKYRKHIPNASDWWWTLTADSLVYEHLVRSVYSSGSLSSRYAFIGYFGVRPLCALIPETKVEVCE